MRRGIILAGIRGILITTTPCTAFSELPEDGNGLGLDLLYATAAKPLSEAGVLP